ncbi:hypothetical protein ADUPG1_012554, partial [Aduncisulcus paluster]
PKDIDKLFQQAMSMQISFGCENSVMSPQESKKLSDEDKVFLIIREEKKKFAPLMDSKNPSIRMKMMYSVSILKRIISSKLLDFSLSALSSHPLRSVLLPILSSLPILPAPLEVLSAVGLIDAHLEEEQDNEAFLEAKCHKHAIDPLKALEAALGAPIESKGSSSSSSSTSALLHLPGYFIGRRVLANLPVLCNVPHTPSCAWLTLPMKGESSPCKYITNKSMGSLKYVTPNCFVNSYDPLCKSYIVSVAATTHDPVGADGKSLKSIGFCRCGRTLFRDWTLVEISANSIYHLNQPTRFEVKHSTSSDSIPLHSIKILLDDGMYVSLSDTATKTLLCAAVIKCGPRICSTLKMLRQTKKSLDSDDSMTDQWKDLFNFCFSLYDCTHFHVVDYDKSRYSGQNFVKLCQHGQGHCHTLSSIMSAFLLACASPLGVGVRFVTCSFVGSLSSEKETDSSPSEKGYWPSQADSHTYLEVCLPDGEALVVCPSNNIVRSLGHVYSRSGCWIRNVKHQCGSKIPYPGKFE